MTIAAAKEIEQSAKRWWRFWDDTVVQQVPDLGKKVLRVNRGITPLPDGAHQVVIRLADSRVYVAPTLEEIETDPNWKTQSE